MSNLSFYDHYLADDGAAAIVVRESLMSVEGNDGVLFPSTFAAGDGFKGGYHINPIGDEKDGKNICLIDSVGSQANRIEPLFTRRQIQAPCSAGRRHGRRKGSEYPRSWAIAPGMRCSDALHYRMNCRKRSVRSWQGIANHWRKSPPRRSSSACGIRARPNQNVRV